MRVSWSSLVIAVNASANGSGLSGNATARRAIPVRAEVGIAGQDTTGRHARTAAREREDRSRNARALPADSTEAF
jgi:hypothetical protein